MEDFARRISIQTEGTNNVLVIELQPGETLIPYCCKVMERNNIPGLLRMRHQSMDGVIRLRYNIGGKVPLREFMLRHHLTYQNGIRLLRNLCDALLHLNEYFLSVDMCYLDPEQIYVGDGLCVYLPCIPMQRDTVQNTSTRLKTFFEKLLSEYFATADCSSYDDMFKWVYKATLFDLETFCKTFLKEDRAAPGAPAQAAPAAPAPAAPAPKPAARQAETPVQSAAPAPQPGQLTELLQEKMKGLQSIYPGGGEEKEKPVNPLAKVLPEKEKPAAEPAKPNLGFEIPGGGSFVVPGAEDRRKPKAEKERKGFWPFGSRGEKAPEQEAPQPAPAPAPKERPAPVVRPAAEKPAAPSQGDEWEEGTILVDSHDYTPAPKPQREEPQATAYLVHNNQNIPITETPFMMGKYNTTIRLHYAIYDNNKVSRNHATILFDNGQYFVRDNQSRNGTTVNGKAILPLQPVALKDGDEIRLYDEVLVFHLG